MVSFRMFSFRAFANRAYRRLYIKGIVPVPALGPDTAAMPFYNPLGNRQAQPKASILAAGLINAVETLKYILALRLGKGRART